MTIRTKKFAINRSFDESEIARFAASRNLRQDQIVSAFAVAVAEGRSDFYILYEDDTIPEVDRTTPRDGESAVALNQDIVLYFSEDVTFSTSSVEIIDGTGNPVTPSSVSVSGSVVTISGVTTAVTTYTVTVIAANVTDQSGNRMASNYQFQFTTSTSTLTGAFIAGKINADSSAVVNEDSIQSNRDVHKNYKLGVEALLFQREAYLGQGEDFYYDNSQVGSSAGVVDDRGFATSPTGILQSNTYIGPDLTGSSTATGILLESEHDGTVAYEYSPDGGGTFNTITPGSQVAVSPSSDLRVKATLTSNATGIPARSYSYELYAFGPGAVTGPGRVDWNGPNLNPTGLP